MDPVTADDVLTVLLGMDANEIACLRHAGAVG